MTNLAYIFPGQGAQYPGMGKSFYEKSPAIKSLFEKSNKILGFDITDLCFNGPQEELTKTENCQPAILLVSIAALMSLKEGFPSFTPALFSGLSLGEYTALVAAGSISVEDALVLVRKRGQIMERAAAKNPGKMSSILGLDLDKIREICLATGAEVANINCPGQTVITGKVDLVNKAGELAKAAGAKRIIDLDVSGAFHSSLMKDAAGELAVEINKVKVNNSTVPVVTNVDGLPYNESAKIKENLVKQLYSSVYWQECMLYMGKSGISKFLEIGPGKVLKGLARKIDEKFEDINIEKIEDLINLKEGD